MSRIDIAVIGCGGMGWTDIESLSKSQYVSRIVGFEPNEKRRQETEEKFNIEVADNLDRIWSDRSIRIVFITSPGATHRELGIAAMKAGKSVMMEKPLCLNLKEMEDVLEVQRQTGAFFQLGFECRYSRLYVRVKEIIDSGEIGDVKNVNLNYHSSPWEKSESGWKNWKFQKEGSGGLFQEKLCHYIDIVRWWIREPVVRFFCIKAGNTIPYYEVPDNAQCSYQFQSGIVSNINFLMQVAQSGNENLMEDIDIATQVNDGHKLTYVVVGTEGAVETALFNREIRVFYHQGKPGYGAKEHMVRVERWRREEDYTYFHDTVTQNEDIARRVAMGLPPAFELEDAAESMRLSFEMEEAATSGKWAVVERKVR